MRRGKAPGLLLPSFDDALAYAEERRAEADEDLQRQPGDRKAEGRLAAYADVVFLMRGEHRAGTVLEVLMRRLARLHGTGAAFSRWLGQVRG